MKNSSLIFVLLLSLITSSFAQTDSLEYFDIETGSEGIILLYPNPNEYPLQPAVISQPSNGTVTFLGIDELGIEPEDYSYYGVDENDIYINYLPDDDFSGQDTLIMEVCDSVLATCHTFGIIYWVNEYIEHEPDPSDDPGDSDYYEYYPLETYVNTPIYFYVPTETPLEQELSVYDEPSNGTIEFTDLEGLGIDPTDPIYENIGIIMGYIPDEGFSGLDSFIIQVYDPYYGETLLLGVEMHVFGEAPDGVYRLFGAMGGTTTTSTFEFLSEESTSIYPNPAKDVINIQVEGMENTRMELSWYSPEGRLVRSEATTNGRLNISALPSGLYFLEINTNGKRFVKKVKKD